MAVKVNIWDTNNAHSNSWKEAGLECGIRIDNSPLITGPENVEWVRGLKSFEGITVFTDSYLDRELISSVDSTVKVGLVMEPIAHKYKPYDDIQEVEDLLDFIFTFNKQLIDKNPAKYKFIPADWCCIEEASHGGSKKDSLVSMIYSNKGGIDRPVRHRVAERFGDKIDLFGGHKGEVELKSDTLNKYMFSIAIENSIDNFYYTEKIIDCFITKNIPIYRGAKNIGEFFDERGIIQWTDINELNDILDSISPKKYSEMLPYIEKNYYIAKGYINPDDIFYELINKCVNSNNYDTIGDFRYEKKTK
jgi:hypothetical protein